MTPHFTDAELGITATTPPEHVASMARLAWCILEPIRAHVGGPVRVNFGDLRFRGYRPAGCGVGNPNGQHYAGEAADIDAPGTDLVALWRWIAFSSGLPFGQCILERRRPGPYTWIHVSSGWPLCDRPLARSRQALVSPDGVAYLPATASTVPPK